MHITFNYNQKLWSFKAPVMFFFYLSILVTSQVLFG